MKLRISVSLLAAAAALCLLAAGQASASVPVSPQATFQGTRPEPPGSGGPEIE